MLAQGAGAVPSHTLTQGRAAATLPHNIVVRIVVYRDIVVHGVIGDILGTPHTGKYSRVEHAQERLCGGRRGDLAAQDFAGGPAATVQLLVGISSLDDTAALQTDTGKQALCLAVAENTRYALEAGCAGCLGIATHGTSGNGDVASQCQRSGLGKCSYGSSIVQDEDEVGELETNLSTEAAANGTDGRGRRPRSIGETSDHDARAESRCAEEAGLEDSEDGEALQCNSRQYLVSPWPVLRRRGGGGLAAWRALSKQVRNGRIAGRGRMRWGGTLPLRLRERLGG